VGGDYFADIAKLRALRRGWSLLAKSYGLPGRCLIMALPSLRNKTLYDYNTNMLRTTLECMAAVLGGADLICNRPYDALYHLPNEFADRIARNQLLLLRHEAYLNQVANAADGSFYLESLTDQLGRKALDLFKTLEQGGGLLAQLKAHAIQKKIRESAEKEQEAFDAGRRVLVGSNRYPNPADRMRGENQRVATGQAGRKTLLEPLPLRRLAEAYEKNRLKDEPS
jgi:methylmalonyl-CoA mutase